MFGKNKSDDLLIKKTIKNCPLFEGLSNSEIRDIVKTAHLRDYSRSEKIFAEGTLGICFYIVAKGTIQLITEDGPALNVLKEYGEQSYFSEVHLFSEAVHTVSCISKDITKLVILTKPDFEDLVKLNPKLGNKMLMRFLEFISEQLDKLYKENRELSEQVKKNLNRD